MNEEPIELREMGKGKRKNKAAVPTEEEEKNFMSHSVQKCWCENYKRVAFQMIKLPLSLATGVNKV